MDWKKIYKRLLFPHIAMLIVLLPVATVLLVYSMVFVGNDSVIAYVSYVLAAYTLTLWCVRMPGIIRFFKTFKNENRYALRWREDTRLRVKLSLYASLLWNAAYAVFQLGLGIYNSSLWFYSMATYYISLAVMRFFLAKYTTKHEPGVQIKNELFRYRACGIVFLLMNLALSVMIFFMVYLDRSFSHNEIITIALAAYTFGSFTMAVVNVVKYRKYNSPIFSAAKAISLASACVSMLTLEATMLTTFDDGMLDTFSRKMMLGLSGGAVSAFILAMAVYMIANSSKKIKQLRIKEK